MFLSTSNHTIDAKGRTSVPSGFRDAVGDDAAVYVWPSVQGAFLEGGGKALMESIQREIFDRVSDGTLSLEEAEAQQVMLLGEAHRLAYDTTGRVVLPKALRDYAGLSGSAAFVGLGNRFHIWEPKAHDVRKAEMRERVKNTPLIMGNVRP